MVLSEDIKNDEKKKAVAEGKKSDLKVKSVKLEEESKDGGYLAYRHLIQPWITEKSHAQMASNKYIFKVLKDSDKKKVAMAVETLYGVNVIAVNMVNIPAKNRRYGKSVGKKAGFKKAIVSLKEGDRIEIFEGA
ncbi:MAG: large subunit ribosomal protein L23 [Parcubacteria group bacterium Athens0714_25]|nr:MAG: large subunit ribosomal protein L23 [Parcubacteria group bacterium Athens0714_25]